MAFPVPAYAMLLADRACTTTRRVLVHVSQLEELERRLVNAYKQVRIGDPLDPQTLMGPLIDPSAIERYQAAIRAAQEAGGKVIYGGKVISRPGNFVEPTILRARNGWGSYVFLS